MPLHSNPAREPDKLGVAGEKDMLAVIDLAPVDPERCGPPPKNAAPLEELDLASRLLELHPGRETRDSCSDDPYAVVSHDSTATRSFSTFDSEARWRRGSSGSRSIRLRIR